MSNVFGNIRFVVLLLGFLLSVGIAFFVESTIPSETLQTIRLTQFYALTAVCFLYLTLIAGPLTYTFRSLPFRGPYLKSRRALGVLTFYYSLLHVYFAFFKQLGGFEGLGFLSGKFLLAISFSAIALFILMLLATTSFDALVKRLTFPKWKLLHRFVYIAGILILVHAMMLGTHFEELTDLVPQTVFLGLVFLFMLESLRIDAILRRKFQTMPAVGLTALGIAVLSAVGFVLLFLPSGNRVSLGIHSQHIELAKQAQQGITAGIPTTNNLPNIPGLQGDRTKRYTVSFNDPADVQPNETTELVFLVNDASSGEKIAFFNKLNDKIAHLIIVNDKLTYFRHVHPDQVGNGFTITHEFPTSGRYHLYIDFQPFKSIEQQMAFTLDVGNFEKEDSSTIQPDSLFTKTFEDYEVTLEYPKPLKASQLSVGQQLLTYTIKDAKTKKPVTTLKPYLAAFGHVVMINKDTFDYLHVHPNDVTPPPANQNGGPKVAFMPLGLYGPIKPGIYKVFAQFNPNNELFTSNFTILVE